MGDSEAATAIDAIIAAIPDWRGPKLARIRRLILDADPDIVEEVKWKKPSNPAGVPTWSRGGILLTGQAFKGKVKLTFASGARLEDPSRLFNASLEGNAMRAIDIGEGDELDESAFKALVREAVALNLAKTRCLEGQRTPARSSSGPSRPVSHSHHILKSAASDQSG